MNRKNFTDRMADWIINIIFLIFTILCIYPFYYLIINTLSANNLSASGEILFWPKQLHFRNYIDVLKIDGLFHAAVISFARTIIGTIGTVLGSAFLGFMFTQQDMMARKFWYRYTVITMYVSAGLIPWYLTMMNLHLLNNFLAYVIPGIVAPFNIILVKTYAESTPKELQEAGIIDGANVMKVFIYIMLPICKPILATVAIFSAVGQWNSFQDTLFLVTNNKLYTLQYLLYQYVNQASSLASVFKNSSSAEAISNLATAQTPTSIRMTVAVVVVLPVLIIYPVFQKFFVKGIMIGSVKG